VKTLFYAKIFGWTVKGKGITIDLIFKSIVAIIQTTVAIKI